MGKFTASQYRFEFGATATSNTQLNFDLGLTDIMGDFSFATGTNYTNDYIFDALDNSASGGFVIYPNKVNYNQSVNVYAK